MLNLNKYESQASLSRRLLKDLDSYHDPHPAALYQFGWESEVKMNFLSLFSESLIGWSVNMSLQRPLDREQIEYWLNFKGPII